MSRGPSSPLRHVRLAQMQAVERAVCLHPACTRLVTWEGTFRGRPPWFCGVRCNRAFWRERARLGRQLDALAGVSGRDAEQLRLRLRWQVARYPDIREATEQGPDT